MFQQQFYKDRKKMVKNCMDKQEWTKELDTFLIQSVVRNYFDFRNVAKELNHES